MKSGITGLAQVNCWRGETDIDDIREASSLVLMEALSNAGANVQAYDPETMKKTQRICGNRSDLTLMSSKEAALKGADALVIGTEWQNFKAPDFNTVKEELSEAVLFDGRNLFEPTRMKTKGFDYSSIVCSNIL